MLAQLRQLGVRLGPVAQRNAGRVELPAQTREARRPEGDRARADAAAC